MVASLAGEGERLDALMAHLNNRRAWVAEGRHRKVGSGSPRHRDGLSSSKGRLGANRRREGTSLRPDDDGAATGPAATFTIDSPQLSLPVISSGRRSVPALSPYYNPHPDFHADTDTKTSVSAVFRFRAFSTPLTVISARCPIWVSGR